MTVRTMLTTAAAATYASRHQGQPIVLALLLLLVLFSIPVSSSSSSSASAWIPVVPSSVRPAGGYGRRHDGAKNQKQKQCSLMGGSFLSLANTVADSGPFSWRLNCNARRRQGRGRNSDAYWEEEDEEHYNDDKEEALEWERCGDNGGDGTSGACHVLLPPLSSRSTTTLPTCILVFSGGTLFGSAPLLWYRRLLEDLVIHTQAAVVATTIPVSFTTPLDHVTLARKVQRQWQTAYSEILVDEYGMDALQNVPVCGIGHSLGARLLVVLATLNSNCNNSSRKKRQRSLQPPPFKSYILMSFTNFGAAAGIPGLAQLRRASRNVERQQQQQRNEEAYAGERARTGTRTRRRKEEWVYDEDDFKNDYDDNDDEDDNDLWNDLQGLLQEQTSRLQNALTPSEEKLEFHPTPQQLWNALENNQQQNRYNIPQTLVVQFDDDKIDQSSKLAAILARNNAHGNNGSNGSSTRLRFARLRGTHLTPVSTRNNDAGAAGLLLNQINSKTGQLLYRLLAGRNHNPQYQQSSSSGNNDDGNDSSSDAEFRDLRQTIARYATEIVTKD